MEQPLPPNFAEGIKQLYPSLLLPEVLAWYDYISTQPDYDIAQVGQAVCITKVFNQIDPPWLRVAQEVAWWGHGRDVVRALQRGMDWARLQGAQYYGYSLAPELTVVKWRPL